jgi:AraC family transcriptional regulator, regulatory protein of adaptative response / DNA-3-methyladenine glycosylase II
MKSEEWCRRAVAARDARFDGQFVMAVRTTGIYCRPSCPAPRPKPANVGFYATAAAAQRAGFRACRRCLPDAAPGSPRWNLRSDLAGRAMRLIADGLVDRGGVAALAEALGYSQRQLNRVLTAELGAGPLALARAHRAHTARILVQTTALPMSDIAFAAGFGGIRQFNQTIREVFALSPTALRAVVPNVTLGTSVVPSVTLGTTLTLRLPYRAPYHRDWTLRQLGAHAAAGAESLCEGVYRRALRAPHRYAGAAMEFVDH